jgi:Protein of unknown function (DUF3800)
VAQIERPYPLLSAPGLPSWKRFLARDYLVFVDESFERFLKMTTADSKYGNFAYGGLGVPASEYERLKHDLAPVVEDYLKLVPGGEIEFKHREFKRIPYTDRRSLAKRMAQALWERGAFISGFYIPSRSLVMEQVRESLMFDHDELPADTSELYDIGVEELRQMFYNTGEKSELLSCLLTKAVAAWAYMLGFLDCHFRVFYDPREPDEDASVKEKIDSMARAMAQLSPEVEGLFLGLDIHCNSEDELGLQLADLVAGETREFFKSYPEMMSHGATRRIINQFSEEDLEVWDVARPKNLVPTPNKMGALMEMPKEIAYRFAENDPAERTVMNCFSPLISSGILTCYSSTGSPRHLMPFMLAIMDQADDG